MFSRGLSLGRSRSHFGSYVPRRTFISPIDVESSESIREPDRKTWVPLLKDQPIQSLVDNRRALQTIRRTDPLGIALQQLNKGNILSLPVLDEKEPNINNIVGFVDVLDICVGVMKSVASKIDPTTTKFSRDQIEFLQEQGRQFIKSPCSTIINASGRDPVQFLSSNSSVLDAIKALQNNHRIVLRDSEGQYSGIVAQWDILRFLLSRHIFRGSQLSMEAGYIYKQSVECIHENDRVLAALKKLCDFKISGLAVINGDAKLTTNIGPSDFKSLTEDQFILLTSTVQEFLVELFGYVRPPVTCSVKDDLEKVFLLMSHHSVHHVYVVDEYVSLKGVISLSDLMKFFATKAE